MPRETKVLVHDYQVHPQTGRIEVHLRCHHTEEDGCTWHGPVKQYSVDPQMLRDRFNNDIEQFEIWAANEHRSIVGAPAQLVTSLLQRKGRVIG